MFEKTGLAIVLFKKEVVAITHYFKMIDFFGEEAVKAGNEDLEMVLVPGWGSNVISLVAKKRGVSLLKTPDSAEEFYSSPVVYGIPILFPPNRIQDGRYTFKQRNYQFIINDFEGHNHEHGFLYDKKWGLLRAEAAEDQVYLETQFVSSQYHEVTAQFPHEFAINMHFLLKGSSLTKRAIIKNLGSKAFPWGFGYHTTFNFPFKKESPNGKLQFSIPVQKQWILNERMLPTGKIEDTELVNMLKDGLDPTGLPSDDVFLRADCPNQAVLTDFDAHITVIYRCDHNFTQWVVYNGNGKEGFICPEPYTWVTNAPNLDIPASLTGIQILEPGEEVILESEISIFNI